MTYCKEYYEKNKEKYKARTKKWRENNKERFYELVKKSRTKRAKELQEKGEIYCWHSNKKRQELYEKRNQRINRSNKDEEI